MTLAYSIDTSSLIAAWDEWYQPESFPSFWTRLTDLVASGKAQCVDEVREELKKKNDELWKWTKGVHGLYLPLDQEIQAATSAILSHTNYRRLTNSVKGRGRADPFVIALAQVHGATVVTEERSAPSKMKIPDVCHGLGIECIRLPELVKREGWRF